MTTTEKRELKKALSSIKSNIKSILDYLNQPMVSLATVNDMLLWADDCHAELVAGVIQARDDDTVDWDTFTSLVWLRNDLGRVCHALRYCLQEQQRID